MQDEEIVEKFQNGDRSVFDHLIDRYHQPVARTCFRFLGHKEDAEDAAQEVFVKVYQSLNRFRPDAKFSTWLYRIAVNHCLNVQRSRKRKALFQSLNPFKENDSSQSSALNDLNRPDKNMEQNERAMMVKNAIDALPKSQRTALILRRYEGLSYKEIANVMGTSIASVESRLHRAKANLYKTLKQYYKD